MANDHATSRLAACLPVRPAWAAVIRREFSVSTPKPTWAGFAVIAASLGAAFLSQAAGLLNTLPSLCVFSLIGIVALFYGTQATRALAGPLLLLFFAVPLPKFFYYALTSQLQTASTSLGVFFLGLLHVPVFQDGNIIDLGGYQLQVAEACSGIRYLFPLMGLLLLACILVAPFVIAGYVGLTVLLFLPLLGLRRMFPGNGHALRYSSVENLLDTAARRA